MDAADETMGKKIRNATQKKVPYVVVVGDKELADEPWMVRVRGQEEQLKITKEDFLKKINIEIKEKK